jgi:hypothetical protein
VKRLAILVTTTNQRALSNRNFSDTDLDLLCGSRRVEGPLQLSGGLLMVEVEVDGGKRRL